MDLSTILLLLETPPPKGGHSLLVDHLYNSARSTPVAGRKRYQHQHQHFQAPVATQTTPSFAPPALAPAPAQVSSLVHFYHQHHHSQQEDEEQREDIRGGQKKLQLLHSKQYYCSNPMLNNNLHCNLDMESLEEMLKKVGRSHSWKLDWGLGLGLLRCLVMLLIGDSALVFLILMNEW